MFKKVIFSFQANFLVAILSLITTLITAKFLGSYGKGYLSIITIYISVVQLINEIFGVGTVLFLLKKYQMKEIFLISYFWFLMVSIVSTLVISFFNLIEKDLQVVFFFNTIFISVFMLNLRVVLNKMNIKWYNFLIILQPLILLLFLIQKGLTFFTVKDFLLFQLFSYSIISVVALIVLRKELKKDKLRYDNIKPLFVDSISLGIVNQTANFSQIINYRVSYFFIEKFVGLKAVGVFSIVLSFANVIWLFATSTGTLLGNEISKTDKLKKSSVAQFFKYMKISVFFTLLTLIIVYIIPSHVYVKLLNKDFSSVKPLLLMMAPAILMFTLAKILGYFFSSLGKMKINLYSSLAGLIPSVLLGYILVKEFKIFGAVMSCSISFIISSIVLLYFFLKEKYKFREII
ncbi:hypothetical protein A5893_03735 [Pedobacter psychrophilus]|uniref:Uncharacterized protein n=1 Tax=Pedobacter psychrophilus TaxID=1826909 RepID=A0A179DMG7_9SPHI|nr:polysaccharide biosynthesis C-terminal domain-containing protein [Pedobacter psychrophilus]OAQ42235.1 hypothetical protein A5893_03735 [Pedobacter psychrophilus]